MAFIRMVWLDKNTSVNSNTSRPHQAAGGGHGRVGTLERLMLVFWTSAQDSFCHDK